MSNYWVMAELSEPKYATEWKYLDAELSYVHNILESKGRRGLHSFSLPEWGVFSHKDWKRYEQELRKYAEQLDKYAKGVDEGVLPVKFSVFNHTGTKDSNVAVKLKVTHGRVDELRKAPKRPDRLDANSKPWKFKVPPVELGFARRRIKITAHGVAAELSALGPQDGAALINQVLHIHCGPDTVVTYELNSHNVERETGQVEVTNETAT